MAEKPSFPGYDTLARRDTQSWNEPTRQAINARLSVPREPRFFTVEEWDCADALCQLIIPGVIDPPLVALLDAALRDGDGHGTRTQTVPYRREAWRQGVNALDSCAQGSHGKPFAQLGKNDQSTLLETIQRGEPTAGEWGAMEPQDFFKRCVLGDIPALFYSLPQAWNEIGFGGPASPRGYVRLELGHRDPWEAAEVGPDGDSDTVERKNRHVV